MESLEPGDLVQLVELRMTELNGEQGYILRLVPGHKEERVEAGKPRGKPPGNWPCRMPSKNEIFVQFANLKMAMEIVGLPIEHGDFSWFLSKNGN